MSDDDDKTVNWNEMVLCGLECFPKEPSGMLTLVMKFRGPRPAGEIAQYAPDYDFRVALQLAMGMPGSEALIHLLSAATSWLTQQSKGVPLTDFVGKANQGVSFLRALELRPDNFVMGSVPDEASGGQQVAGLLIRPDPVDGEKQLRVLFKVRDAILGISESRNEIGKAAEVDRA